jgi:hypothetical protein
MSWPDATLDPIRRLRVMAAVVPGSVVVEAVLDAPLAEVWAVATGFEEYLHRFELGIRSAHIAARSGGDGEERLDLRIRTVIGLPMRMDVLLRPGWCWMEARPRTYTVGLAAVADGARTRFGHLEGVPLPGGRFAAPLIRRSMSGDLRRIEALAIGLAGGRQRGPL